MVVCRIEEKCGRLCVILLTRRMNAYYVILSSILPSLFSMLFLNAISVGRTELFLKPSTHVQIKYRLFAQILAVYFV